MHNTSDEILRKIRHDFKMDAEELLSAIALHGTNDGNKVDSEDSKEVFDVLKKMKSLWGQLEKVKEEENAARK